MIRLPVLSVFEASKGLGFFFDRKGRLGENNVLTLPKLMKREIRVGDTRKIVGDEQ